MIAKQHNQKESDLSKVLEKVHKCKNIDELVRVCTESTEVRAGD